MLDKQCLCGHARSVHRSAYAECRSVNVLDDRFHDECECQRFENAPVSETRCTHGEKLEALAFFLEWMNAK